MNFSKRLLILILSMVFVLTFSGVAFAAAPADGKYTISVSFVEKSSRVYVESPAHLTVKDGKITARITFKRYIETEITKYSSLTMNGVTYMNSGKPGENSTFEDIPVTAFDSEISIEAFSDAMGVNITYKLFFDSSSLKVIELEEEILATEETAETNKEKEVAVKEVIDTISEKVVDTKETEASSKNKVNTKKTETSGPKNDETRKESTAINSKKENVNKTENKQSKAPISNKEVETKDTDATVSTEVIISKDTKDQSSSHSLPEDIDQDQIETPIDNTNVSQEPSEMDQMNVVDNDSNDAVICEHLYVDGYCEKCGIEDLNYEVSKNESVQADNVTERNEITADGEAKAGNGTIGIVVIISVIIISAILGVKIWKNRMNSLQEKRRKDD